MFSEPDLNFFVYDEKHGVGAAIKRLQSATPETVDEANQKLVIEIAKYVRWVREARFVEEVMFPGNRLTEALNDFLDGKIQLPETALRALIRLDAALKVSPCRYNTRASRVKNDFPRAVLRLYGKSRTRGFSPTLCRALSQTPSVRDLNNWSIPKRRPRPVIARDIISGRRIPC